MPRGGRRVKTVVRQLSERAVRPLSLQGRLHAVGQRAMPEVGRLQRLRLHDRQRAADGTDDGRHEPALAVHLLSPRPLRRSDHRAGQRVELRERRRRTELSQRRRRRHRRRRCRVRYVHWRMAGKLKQRTPQFTITFSITYNSYIAAYF